MNRVPGTLPRVLRHANELGAEYSEDRARPVATIEEANLVTSEAADRPGVHYPVIDLDLPCELVPSTTEGHFHLYIDRAITWAQYSKILTALAEAGILEEGYVRASVARLRTDVRLPWIRKPAAAEVAQ